MDARTLNRRRAARTRRVRGKIFGTARAPRISVRRSNRHLAVQLIDDERGVTLVSATTRECEARTGKAEQATLLGALLASRAKEAGITTAVFGKGWYAYHGRVRALVEALRGAGMKV